MKILDLVIDKRSGTISSEILSDSKEVYFIIMNSLGTVCSCLGDQMRPHKDVTCKHKRFFFSYIVKYTGLDLNFIYEVDNKMAFLKTGLGFFDDLFDGIPYRQLYALVGPPKSGKTTLAYQLLHHISFAEDQDVLFIDGEGGIYDFVIKKWLGVFNNKYDLDLGADLWELWYPNWVPKKDGRKKAPPKKITFKHNIDSKKKRKVHVLDLIGTDGHEPIEKLNLLVGKPSRYTISAGGKISIKPTPEQLKFSNAADLPLTKFVKDHEIIAVVLDSLTMVVDTKYSGETEAFPARAKNNMQVCNQLQIATSYNNLYTIVNHHLTINPQNPYDVGQMTGGKGTGHNFKFQGLLDFYGSSPSKRWFKCLRHQTKPTGLKTKCEITSNGIVELLDDD